ncbi:MAG: flagellar basal-body rod protein FlgF [Kiloniellales bacterium]|nr:flagellar basal-body rod protein FlgF [Kiloniellales bacterium]
METPGYIALSKQMVLRQQMDLIANNLANMNTAGYKAERMVFAEHLDRTEDGKVLSFVQDLAVTRDLSQGPLTLTSNELNFAIRGEGYFAVQTDAGVRYTRAGNFSLDANGQIVNLEGHALLGAGNTPITLPANTKQVILARDGTLSTDTGEAGRIEVQTFENEQRLTKVGGNLLDAGEAEPQRVANATLEQGYVEGSNTKAVIEMTRMIDTVRSYQSTSRFLEQEDQRQRSAIETLIAA